MRQVSGCHVKEETEEADVRAEFSVWFKHAAQCMAPEKRDEDQDQLHGSGVSHATQSCDAAHGRMPVNGSLPSPPFKPGHQPLSLAKVHSTRTRNAAPSAGHKREGRGARAEQKMRVKEEEEVQRGVFPHGPRMDCRLEGSSRANRFWPFSSFHTGRIWLRRLGPLTPTTPAPLVLPPTIHHKQDVSGVTLPGPPTAVMASAAVAAASSPSAASATKVNAAGGTVGNLLATCPSTQNPQAGNSDWERVEGSTRSQGSGPVNPGDGDWKPGSGGLHSGSGKSGSGHSNPQRSSQGSVPAVAAKSETVLSGVIPPATVPLPVAVVPALGWWEVADCDDCKVGSSGFFEEARQRRRAKVKVKEKENEVACSSRDTRDCTSRDDMMKLGEFPIEPSCSPRVGEKSRPPVPPLGWWEGDGGIVGGSTEVFESAREKRACRKLHPWLEPSQAFQAESGAGVHG